MKVIHEEITRRGWLQIVESRSRYGNRWFWRTMNKKGEQLSRSSENYERLQGCLRNLVAEKEIMGQLVPIEMIAEHMKIKL